jgi:hypothetical protein
MATPELRMKEWRPIRHCEILLQVSLSMQHASLLVPF